MENPNNLALLLSRTELLHNFVHDYDRVETSYRELLKRDDLTEQQRAVIANNLAVLLAIRHNAGSEALNLVNDALRYFGPGSDLLDTRAMAHLAAGDARSAVDDLATAIADDQASAIKQFHLALAQQAAGDIPSAEQSLARARRLGLKVPELELARYETLVSAIEDAGRKYRGD
jgi:predicted Zn-dependent protease